MHIAEPAIKAAASIRTALREKGYHLFFESPTNQIFVVIENDALKTLGEKVEYGFWEKYDDGHTVIRLATDWATTEAETIALINVL
jgi:threonine aldolase